MGGATVDGDAMTPMTLATLTLTALVLAVLAFEFYRNRRVGKAEKWRRMKRLSSTRATRMLADLAALNSRCRQCGHEREAHALGRGYCGGDSEPGAMFDDLTRQDCWCGRYIRS